MASVSASSSLASPSGSPEGSNTPNAAPDVFRKTAPRNRSGKPTPGVQIHWENRETHLADHPESLQDRTRGEKFALARSETFTFETSADQTATGRLIEGPMKDVLPALEPGSIDFAYIDPPFMTQKDFEIQSKTNARHRLRLVGASKDDDAKPKAGYSDQWDRHHYLDFLECAISSIKPLLKESGSIAIHTDFRVSHYARMLLDEYFTPANFVNELIWKYGLGNARATRHFLRKHDNIAIYAAQSTRKHYFNVLRGEVTPAQKAKYCHTDEGGKYMLSYGKKYYLKGGKPLESVLDIPSLGPTDGERTGYPTQKPTRLLATLIEALCPPDGCVLDACCGSGTTAVAATNLGRSWVAIDANPDAIQIVRERMTQLPTFTTAVES